MFETATCFDCDRRIQRGSKTLAWRTLFDDETACDERNGSHRSVPEAVEQLRQAASESAAL